jgi:glycosyltransferase involved in cell wall biosynthesis
LSDPLRLEQTRPLRVLLISDVYFPRVNGVSTSIRTFRADLSAAGVQTLLVAPAYGDGVPEDRSIVRVPAAAVPGDPEDRRMRLGALRAALARLSEEPFDLVHVQTPFLAHYAGVRFARGRNLRVVATYHTLFEEYLHHYVPVLPRVLGRSLARSFTRSQCAQLHALVAPSEPMRDLLREYGVRTRIEVIPTGLPADRYVPGEGLRFREQFGIELSRPLLLYVGRVAHEKNIGFLLHAFAALRRTHPQALLAIAGEGPARASLQELTQQLALNSHVRFIGYLERERALRDCYAAADIFVFASRTETQGLVLLEALAQGCPVVSTAHLGTASILKNGCGACVVPEKIEAFAQALAALLDEPTRAARLAAEARRYAQSWASAQMAQRLAALYRDLTGTPATRAA